MKIFINFLFLLSCVGFLTSHKTAEKNTTVRWYTFEEAVALNKKNPKKIYIDIYTNWCGPCKMMDKNTFSNPEIAQLLNTNYYPVKLNAEQKEDIVYDGYTFKYMPNGNRGVHYFAYSILDQKVMYPSSVFLDEQRNRISIVPGYIEPQMFRKLLSFHTGNHYAKKSWEDYQNNNK